MEINKLQNMVDVAVNSFFAKHKIKNGFMDIDDYKQECLMAVLSKSKYDPSKGPEENYINTIIRNSINDSLTSFLVEFGGTVRTKGKIIKANLDAENNVSVEDTCSTINIKDKTYKAYINCPKKEYYSENMTHREKEEKIEDYLEPLDEESKEIMRMAANGMSHSDISGKMNLTPLQVRYKFKKSCKIIKDTYDSLL